MPRNKCRVKTKTNTITLRLSDAEFSYCAAVADEMGLTLSEAVRRMLFAYRIIVTRDLVREPNDLGGRNKT